MKRILSMMIALVMMTGVLATSLAENNPMGTPPDGAPGAQMGTPPDGAPGGDMGAPPDGAPGGQMGTPPDGAPGGQMGGPGGGNSAPTEYAAAVTVTEDTELTGEITSMGTDENAVLVESGTASIHDATIVRSSDDSTGGDASSFYGVGAAVLTTGGTVVIENSTIETDAAGGAGVFAYSDGVAYVSEKTLPSVIQKVNPFESGLKWSHFLVAFESGLTFAQ